MAALRAAFAVLAAGAVLAAVLLARGGGAPATAPTAPAVVRTSLGADSVDFGAPLTARLVVVLDRDAVHVGSLDILDDLAPLTVLAPARTTRTRSGRLETVTVTQQVACLTADCLGGAVRLPKATVTVDGTTVRTPWRSLHVRSRVSAKDLARATPRLAADTTPPAPAYRVSPVSATTALEAIAGVAAAGAVALLALEAFALRRRRLVDEQDELTRALRLLRESEGRDVPDRRRALGLLSRLAGDRAARDLAWSAREPDTPAIEDVLERHA
ncbi:MAG: hypothetical protein ABUS54_11390 [Actinomycetota bacterium]